jgi:hypothetical protein
MAIIVRPAMRPVSLCKMTMPANTLVVVYSATEQTRFYEHENGRIAGYRNIFT